MSAFKMDTDVSKLGAWQHELILRADMEKIPDVMRKHDWTCCKCGVRIPGYMQVHHTGRHVSGNVSALRPICIFCHDMEHPLWAANRKRIVPIDAPDISQARISMLAWAVLSLTGGKLPHEADISLDEGVVRVSDSLMERRETLAAMTGGKDADVMLQGYLSVDSTLPKDAPSRKVFDKVVSRIRFAPSFLFAGFAFEAFRVWGPGGFRPAPPEGVLPDLSSEIQILTEIGKKVKG